MAFLVRPTLVYYRLEGKRVRKGTPGAERVKEKVDKWYGCGIPGLPPKRRVPLAKDKTAAKRALDDLVRKAERGEAGVPDRHAKRRPLLEHVADFEQDLGLGIGSRGVRRKHPPSPAQVSLTVQRVKDLLMGCALVMPADLNANALGKVKRYLNARLAKPRNEGGLSAQSCQFFISAVRRFTRWLSRNVTGVNADLFNDVPGFDPENNRKHARREISPDELARILEAARNGTRVYRGLTGEDRYFLYLVAYSTGYRADELAELRPESFSLDADFPAVTLPGRLTKNKKSASQPLPSGVVSQIRSYLASKPVGSPVWPGTWREKPVKPLRIDMAAAGVPYSIETHEGTLFADFHSLRHSYLSSLAAAGVGTAELQALARHSDPRITMGVYVHARAEVLGASVARLILPGSGVQENPLSKMTRAELESALVGSWAILAVVLGKMSPESPSGLFAPLLAPSMENSGDSSGQPKTKVAGRAGGKK